MAKTGDFKYQGYGGSGTRFDITVFKSMSLPSSRKQAVLAKKSPSTAKKKKRKKYI